MTVIEDCSDTVELKESCPLFFVRLSYESSPSIVIYLMYRDQARSLDRIVFKIIPETRSFLEIFSKKALSTCYDWDLARLKLRLKNQALQEEMTAFLETIKMELALAGKCLDFNFLEI